MEEGLGQQRWVGLGKVSSDPTYLYTSSMARPVRIEFAGALYHTTSRGDGRKGIYLACQSGGYNMKDIADHFGLHYSSMSKVVKGDVNSRPAPFLC